MAFFAARNARRGQLSLAALSAQAGDEKTAKKREKT
jgi:hypothetical protein